MAHIAHLGILLLISLNLRSYASMVSGHRGANSSVDRKTPIVAQWARAGPDTALLAEQTKLQ